MIYGILCLMVGIIAGARIGAKFARRRDAAPRPIDLSPAPAETIAGGLNGQQRKTVTVCGYEWELRQP